MSTAYYIISGCRMAIECRGGSPAWESLSACYAPFASEAGDAPDLHVTIESGLLPPCQSQPVYTDISSEKGHTDLNVYRDGQGALAFQLQEAFSSQPDAWAEMGHDMRTARIIVDESTTTPLEHRAALTSALMLAYCVANMKKEVLIAHASCVTHNGKAYIFLGKSGTGKSTHSRMWLENIPGTELLNDDHPIIRVDEEGRIVAYGSPWSGKTPCYRNMSAPLGGIVRIRRAPFNAIRPLSTVEAYASLIPSFFNTPFDKELSDSRHRTIEKLVASVPCYELQCLPDAEAAIVCLNGIEN